MTTSTISIVDADPDLAELLDDAQLKHARREALTRVQRLWPGESDINGALEADVHHRGFLIVDGLLTARWRARPPLRRADRPVRRDAAWNWDGPAGVHAEVGWLALEPSPARRPDHALVDRINPWPQLGLESFNRGTRRAHHLAVALAIAHHPRVEDRLLLTLWHLAERWGRVTPDGIVVNLPLGHQRLADIVGAHRPSVTTAMGALAKAGRVEPPRWRRLSIHGDPAEKLRHHKLAAALSCVQRLHDIVRGPVAAVLRSPPCSPRPRGGTHACPPARGLPVTARVGNPQAPAAVGETAVAEERRVLDADEVAGRHVVAGLRVLDGPVALRIPRRGGARQADAALEVADDTDEAAVDDLDLPARDQVVTEVALDEEREATAGGRPAAVDAIAPRLPTLRALGDRDDARAAVRGEQPPALALATLGPACAGAATARRAMTEVRTAMERVMRTPR